MIPTALFLKSRSWESDGPLGASPFLSRGAAGKQSPTKDPPVRFLGQALRASLCHIPAGAARTGRGRRGCSTPALFRRCSGNLHFNPSLFSSQPLQAPAARSQSKERKKKRGGGGAADSGVLPVLLWEDSSAATGGEGLIEGSGEGSGSPRGLALTAPRASSGGGCCTAIGGAGGGSPRGARPPGGGGCLFADLRALLAF